MVKNRLNQGFGIQRHGETIAMVGKWHRKLCKSRVSNWPAGTVAWLPSLSPSSIGLQVRPYVGVFLAQPPGSNPTNPISAGDLESGCGASRIFQPDHVLRNRHRRRGRKGSRRRLGGRCWPGRLGWRQEWAHLRGSNDDVVLEGRNTRHRWHDVPRLLSVRECGRKGDLVRGDLSSILPSQGFSLRVQQRSCFPTHCCIPIVAVEGESEEDFRGGNLAHSVRSNPIDPTLGSD
jgi:hypothetical protein